MISELKDAGYEFATLETAADELHLYRTVNAKPLYFVRTNTNDDPIPFSHQKVVFARANMECTGLDFYRAYYDLTDDDFCKLENGYSLHTKQYLDDQRAKIGLSRYTVASNDSGDDAGKLETIPMVEFPLPVYLNADTRIGTLPDNTTVVETSYWYTVDDFAVIKIYFDHDPTTAEVLDAFAIKDAEDYFRRAQEDDAEYFVCRTCEHRVQWTEVPGNVREKIDKLKARWCGCC